MASDAGFLRPGPDPRRVHRFNRFPHDTHRGSSDHTTEHDNVFTGALDGLPIGRHLLRWNRRPFGTGHSRIEALWGSTLRGRHGGANGLRLAQALTRPHDKTRRERQSRILIARSPLAEDRDRAVV